MIENNISDIVKNDLCTGCGVCVSEAPSKYKMGLDDYGFLIPKLISSSLTDEKAIKVCPFNPNPEIIVSDEDKIADIFFPYTKKWEEQIGKYEQIYAGHSKEHRVTSSSGGIATYIFKELLSKRFIDHLYIVKESNGRYEYQLFNNIEDITRISKTRYIPVTLEKLFLEINQIEGKIAISGVACFIKAIRLKQHYNPELKDKIPFLIGIICGGLKSKFFTDYLAQQSGIKSDYSKQDYRIKNPKSSAGDYSFGAYDDKNQFHQIRMSKVGDMWGTGLFKANACDFCDDVTTELADISVGDAWIPPYVKDGMGTSVIVTRTEFADSLIKSGIEKFELDVSVISEELFKSSQNSSYKHRQKALKFRVDKRKRNGLLIPHNRSRFFQNIPIEFRLVQNKRSELRLKSLLFWKENPKALEYDKRLKLMKEKLKSNTKLYHRIQKVRSILKMKTI